MSEFEKELEKNIKLNKVAYERESIDSDYFVSKWDIERIFKDWQPLKPLVVVPQIVADFIEVRKKSLKLYDAFQEIEECYCGDLYNFVCQKSNGQDLFARAWLDGYTVEKEKLFYLKNKITGNRLYKQPKEAGSNLVEVIDCLHKSSMMFTQQEIDDMETGSYEQIAVTVNEV